MRATHMMVIAALALVIAPTALHAANCCPTAYSACPSPSCYTPAYDRTPICMVETSPACYGPMGAGPMVVPVDPWAKCGAFCYGGQIAPGWPYGWTSEYWLRPDSNF